MLVEAPVLGFFGEFRFLSNFHLQEITYRNITFPSNEHAFQADKANSTELRQYIADLPKPNDAKKAGRKVDLRPDWEMEKIQVMTDITRLKFQIPELRDRLLATGNAYLEETNTWGDTFWGVCDGIGHNHLGKILMQVRHEIRQARVSDDEAKVRKLIDEEVCVSMSEARRVVACGGFERFMLKKSNIPKHFIEKDT